MAAYKKDNARKNMINSELVLYCYALFFHITLYKKQVILFSQITVTLDTVLSYHALDPPPPFRHPRAMLHHTSSVLAVG